MAKPKLREHRFDLRGGLNTISTGELLAANELRVADNARFLTTGGIGGVGNRTGCRRLHATPFGDAVRGIYQWDAPAGKQLVAIANGKLWYRNPAAGEWGAFTMVTPPTAFSLSGPHPTFAPFRGDGVGAALKLYIGDGTVAYSWSGSALTRVDGTNSFPKAGMLDSYHARLFANSSEYVKHVFYSKITDATDFTAGIGSLGGSQMIGVLTGEAITAIKSLGSGLVIAGPDSLALFTGYSAEDIRIEQDTEGLSTDVGVVGPNAIERVEKLAGIVSDLGPYLVSPGGVSAIGGKIENLFDALDRTKLPYSYVTFHKGRRELWFQVPGRSSTIYVYNLRLNSWTGPFSYPFTIYSMARYEDPLGDEYVLAGGSDGYIRHMDYGALDDVLSSGTGGSAYSWLVEFAPVFFDPGPGFVKQLQRSTVQLVLPVGQNLTWKSYADSRSAVDYAIGGVSSSVAGYRVDLAEQGGRFRFALAGTNSDIVMLNGFSLEAWDYGRPM